MRKDVISAAFETILEEIGAEESQLNDEGAIAFKNGRYDNADRLCAEGKKLRNFRERLKVLRDEWTAGIDLKARKRAKVDSVYRIQFHRKGPRTNLIIILPDGRILKRPTAAQAMVDAIEFIGPEKVRALNRTVSGVPLVSTEKHPKYGQTRIGRYWVCTHSNTQDKKATLEQIAKALGVFLRIEVE